MLKCPHDTPSPVLKMQRGKKLQRDNFCPSIASQLLSPWRLFGKRRKSEPSLWGGEANLGSIFRDNVGEGHCESNKGNRDPVSLLRATTHGNFFQVGTPPNPSQAQRGQRGQLRRGILCSSTQNHGNLSQGKLLFAQGRVGFCPRPKNPWQPDTRQDLRNFHRPDLGQFSPYFVAISLRATQTTRRNRKKNPQRKITKKNSGEDSLKNSRFLSLVGVERVLKESNSQSDSGISGKSHSSCNWSGGSLVGVVERLEVWNCNVSGANATPLVSRGATAVALHWSRIFRLMFSQCRPRIGLHTLKCLKKRPCRTLLGIVSHLKLAMRMS